MSQHDYILQELLKLQKAYEIVYKEAFDQTLKAKQLRAEYATKLMEIEVREKEVICKQNLIFSAEDLVRRTTAVEAAEARLTNLRASFEKDWPEREAVLELRAKDAEGYLKILEAREQALLEEKATYKKILLKKMEKIQEDL